MKILWYLLSIFSQEIFVQWISYLHINIIPFHNTTKIFIHCKYSVKSMIVYISNYHLKGNKFLLRRVYNSEKLHSSFHTLNPETSYLICRYSWQERQCCTKIKYVSNFGDNHFVLKNKKENCNDFITLEKILTSWD